MIDYRLWLAVLFVIVGGTVATISVCLNINYDDVVTVPYTNEEFVAAVTVPSDNISKLDEVAWLREQLRIDVENRGYTWEQWISNSIPKEIKWEITVNNSKRMSEMEQRNNER